MHDGIGHMTPPPGRYSPPMMVNERAVRILLECILVLTSFLPKHRMKMKKINGLGGGRGACIPRPNENIADLLTGCTQIFSPFFAQNEHCANLQLASTQLSL